MTLDCVGITQSSVIQIIHCNVDLKRFYIYLNFLLLSLVSAYIYISQGSVKCVYRVVRYIINILLQIVCRVCQ